jgi:hypothetical protein
MQTIRYVIIFSLLGCSLAQAQILPTFGNSRTGGSGMQFLKISPDARGMAMGGAAVAVTNDASSLFWNPAGITGIDTCKIHVMASHTRYFGDISGNYVGLVKKVGKLSYFGFQVFSMNYGTMDETTEFESKGTGRTFTVSNYTIGLTYAKILTNSFSFGVNAKYANEGFGGTTIHNALFDLGLKYDVGVKHTRFGINFSNFGFNVSPTGDVSVLKFSGPTDITSFSKVSVPGVFRLGIAFDPLHTADHVLTVAGQLNHPTDNNETVAFGTEYTYLNMAHLRAGYEFGSDEKYIAPSAGLGLKLPTRFVNMNIDYGFLAKSRLGNIHRITLAINIR